MVRLSSSSLILCLILVEIVQGFDSLLFYFNFFLRSGGVRMGSDIGGGEYVHKTSSKCSSQAILLQNSVQACRSWNQRQSSLPQCQFDCSSFILFFHSLLPSCFYFFVVLHLWNMFLNSLVLQSQHELASPVKTDSSFWTLGIFSFSLSLN